MGDPDHEPLTFDALIYRRGILRVVDVPEAFNARCAGWRYPPVVATVAGRSRQTTLAARGERGWQLFLHDELRKAAAADTGDTVTVQLQVDESPLEPYPDDVLEVAEALDGGREALELLPAGLRREILRFVGGAKQAPTRRKRLDRVAELLRDRVRKADSG